MARHFTAITKEELRQKILDAWEQHPRYRDGDSMDRDPDIAGAISHIRYSWPTLTNQIQKDFKVVVDFENVECGKEYEYLGFDKDTKKGLYATEPKDTVSNQFFGLNTLPSGLTFLGVYGGGDWECPVHFIIYWDGKKLRCYIPTEGNFWNTTTKTAYGNDEDADSKNIAKRFKELTDPSDPDFILSHEDLPMQNDEDYQKMLEDIDKRVTLK